MPNFSLLNGRVDFSGPKFMATEMTDQRGRFDSFRTHGTCFLFSDHLPFIRNS